MSSARTLRRLAGPMLGAALLVGSTVAWPQSGPAAETAEVPAEPAPREKPAAAPAPSDRAFRPSEEVSPDQEVDFPADI